MRVVYPLPGHIHWDKHALSAAQIGKIMVSTTQPANPFNKIGHHIPQQYAIFYNVDVLYIQVYLLLQVEMQHIMRQAGIVSCPNYKSICKMHNITTSQPMKPKTNTVFVFDVSM